MRYEIRSDGRVVWVNGEHGCVARFGECLAEIARSQNQYVQPNSEPFYWTKQGNPKLSQDDWREFTVWLMIAHGITIPWDFDRTKEQVIELDDGRGSEDQAL